MSDEQGRFTAETKRFRRELLAYCYRVAGSATEAEDLVQETYLRAWRAYAGFERRASMRSWLYKIASLDHARDGLLEPNDPRARELLDGYIAAFERSDASLLLEVLRADATLEATPFRDWQAGKAHCIDLLARFVLVSPTRRGEWKMTPTIANGQPAAIVHRRDAEGAMRPNGIVLLAATPTGISRVVAFHHDPALVELFGRNEFESASTLHD